MADIVSPLFYDVDLTKGASTVRVELPFALYSEDNAAHRIGVRVYQDGKAVDLTGAAVTGYFVRPAKDAQSVMETIPLTGAVNGNQAYCALDAHCYLYSGRFAFVLKVTTSGTVHTLLGLAGTILASRSDSIVDPTNTIPSLDELLAQITATKAATAAANTAASNANAKATEANTAAQTAKTKATEASTAASNANTKAELANKAAQKIDGMTASAVGLEAGAAPTVTVKDVNGVKQLVFGIPKGDTGKTGDPGAPGPKGDTGSIENLTVNGKPVENGGVTLTAEDVGAFPLSDGTAITDCDAAYKSGIHIVSPSTLHIPEANTWAVLVNVVSEGVSYNEETNWIYQFYLPTFGTLSNAWWRKRVNDEGQFSSWKALGCEAYPVGAVYISTISTSPASLFGGTWEAIKDRFLLAAGDTYKAGLRGGDASHTHEVHGHVLKVSEIPAHAHTFSRIPITTTEISGSGNYFAETSTTVGTLKTQSTETAGGGGSHTHGNTGAASSLPPYLSVYIWKRIA